MRDLSRWVTLVAALVLPVGAAAQGAGVPVPVDDFETAADWTAQPADGVEMTLTAVPGERGGALRVDFRFVKGGGYAVLRRALALDLPANYRFTFRVRGDCAPQNLEFKLVDSTGANVWWRNQRDFAFPREWRTVTIRKRQVEFAWGPAGGGELRHVAALEFAITAGSGGSGTVWLDRLELTPLPVPDAVPPPATATASSARSRAEGAAAAVDGSLRTAWVSDRGDRAPWLELDLGEAREFGGLVVDRAKAWRASGYVVEVSDDRAAWRALRTVDAARRTRDPVDLPETEARWVRLRAAGPGTLAVAEVRVMPLEWSATPSAFFRAVARDAPRGTYPRGILGEPASWAVVGEDRDRREGLLGADGALETGAGAYSVEPFLFAHGRLLSWADAELSQSLEDGCLPIPSVRWLTGDLELTVTAFAAPAPGPGPDVPALIGRYRVRNVGTGVVKTTLYLALRPFQVNPPEQFLAVPGGVAPLHTIFQDGRVVRVDGDRGLVSLMVPDGFGASEFDAGDVVADFLRDDLLPARTRVTDPLGRAAGALAYRMELAAGAEEEVDLVVPLAGRPQAPPERGPLAWRAGIEARLTACREAWRARLAPFELELPGPAADVARALQAQIGWILVNRDSAGIQPGSRSYARSWIRDGSLTCTALLRTGHPQPVREFIEWFAPYQYDDGKVPCCVGPLGSDPVPEHDSGGQFIYLVAEYHRHTGERALVERMWPAVAAAAGYLDSLRQQRRTPEWRAPGREEFFGLLPPSISHEGYSAQPMHSYWDDLFALRGFKDAVYLAQVLGRTGDALRLAAIRDGFQRDLAASVRAAMARHGIDYVPGCADLGDFDATSTTVALDPAQAGVGPAAGRARAHLRALLGVRPRPRHGSEAVGELHALRDAHHRRRHPPGLAGAGRQPARVLPRAPRPARLAAVGRDRLVGPHAVALHRRPAAHLGGLGLRALGARPAGLRTRERQLAGARGRRAGGLAGRGGAQAARALDLVRDAGLLDAPLAPRRRRGAPRGRLPRAARGRRAAAAGPLPPRDRGRRAGRDGARRRGRAAPAAGDGRVQALSGTGAAPPPVTVSPARPRPRARGRRRRRARGPRPAAGRPPTRPDAPRSPARGCGTSRRGRRASW